MAKHKSSSTLNRTRPEPTTGTTSAADDFDFGDILNLGSLQSAKFYTGNKMLELCLAYVNETSFAKGNTCAGYVAGIADVHNLFVLSANSSAGMRRQWCIPDGVTTGQLERVAVKSLEESPEDLHMAASYLVAKAFGLAFPCEE